MEDELDRIFMAAISKASIKETPQVKPVIDIKTMNDRTGSHESCKDKDVTDISMGDEEMKLLSDIEGDIFQFGIHSSVDADHQGRHQNEETLLNVSEFDPDLVLDRMIKENHTLNEMNHHSMDASILSNDDKELGGHIELSETRFDDDLARHHSHSGLAHYAINFDIDSTIISLDTDLDGNDSNKESNVKSPSTIELKPTEKENAELKETTIKNKKLDEEELLSQHLDHFLYYNTIFNIAPNDSRYKVIIQKFLQAYVDMKNTSVKLNSFHHPLKYNYEKKVFVVVKNKTDVHQKFPFIQKMCEALDMSLLIYTQDQYIIKSLEDFQKLISSAQVVLLHFNCLLDVFRHGYLKLCQISGLIITDIEEGVKQHPMARFIREFIAPYKAYLIAYNKMKNLRDDLEGFKSMIKSMPRILGFIHSISLPEEIKENEKMTSAQVIERQKWISKYRLLQNTYQAKIVTMNESILSSSLPSSTWHTENFLDTRIKLLYYDGGKTTTDKEIESMYLRKYYDRKWCLQQYYHLLYQLDTVIDDPALLAYHPQYIELMSSCQSLIRKKYTRVTKMEEEYGVLAASLYFEKLVNQGKFFATELKIKKFQKQFLAPIIGLDKMQETQYHEVENTILKRKHENLVSFKSKWIIEAVGRIIQESRYSPQCNKVQHPNFHLFITKEGYSISFLYNLIHEYIHNEYNGENTKRAQPILLFASKLEQYRVLIAEALEKIKEYYLTKKVSETPHPSINYKQLIGKEGVEGDPRLIKNWMKEIPLGRQKKSDITLGSGFETQPAFIPNKDYIVILPIEYLKRFIYWHQSCFSLQPQKKNTVKLGMVSVYVLDLMTTMEAVTDLMYWHDGQHAKSHIPSNKKEEPDKESSYDYQPQLTFLIPSYSISQNSYSERDTKEFFKYYRQFEFYKICSCYEKAASFDDKLIKNGTGAFYDWIEGQILSPIIEIEKKFKRQPTICVSKDTGAMLNIYSASEVLLKFCHYLPRDINSLNTRFMITEDSPLVDWSEECVIAGNVNIENEFYRVQPSYQTTRVKPPTIESEHVSYWFLCKLYLPTIFPEKWKWLTKVPVFGFPAPTKLLAKMSAAYETVRMLWDKKLLNMHLLPDLELLFDEEEHSSKSSNKERGRCGKKDITSEAKYFIDEEGWVKNNKLCRIYYPVEKDPTVKLSFPKTIPKIFQWTSTWQDLLASSTSFLESVTDEKKKKKKFYCYLIITASRVLDHDAAYQALKASKNVNDPIYQLQKSQQDGDEKIDEDDNDQGRAAPFSYFQQYTNAQSKIFTLENDCRFLAGSSHTFALLLAERLPTGMPPFRLYLEKDIETIGSLVEYDPNGIEFTDLELEEIVQWQAYLFKLLVQRNNLYYEKISSATPMSQNELVINYVKELMMTKANETEGGFVESQTPFDGLIPDDKLQAYFIIPFIKHAQLPLELVASELFNTYLHSPKWIYEIYQHHRLNDPPRIPALPLDFKEELQLGASNNCNDDWYEQLIQSINIKDWRIHWELIQATNQPQKPCLLLYLDQLSRYYLSLPENSSKPSLSSTRTINEPDYLIDYVNNDSLEHFLAFACTRLLICSISDDAIYRIRNIRTDLTPSTSIAGNRGTFEDYFREKLGLSIYHKSQLLVEVKRVEVVGNLLKPAKAPYGSHSYHKQSKHSGVFKDPVFIGKSSVDESDKVSNERSQEILETLVNSVEETEQAREEKSRTITRLLKNAILIKGNDAIVPNDPEQIIHLYANKVHRESNITAECQDLEPKPLVSSMVDSSSKDAKQNNTILIPELVSVIPIPSFLFQLGLFIPSIVHQAQIAALTFEYVHSNPILGSIPYKPSLKNCLQALRGPQPPFIKDDYERFEMLGDSYLKMNVSLDLFLNHPKEIEGLLTIKRMKVISNSNLYKVGRSLLAVHKVADITGFVVKTWSPPNITPLFKRLITKYKSTQYAVQNGKLPPFPIRPIFDEGHFWYVLQNFCDKMERKDGQERVRIGNTSHSSKPVDGDQYITHRQYSYVYSAKALADMVESLIAVYFLEAGENIARIFMNALSLITPILIYKLNENGDEITPEEQYQQCWKPLIEENFNSGLRIPEFFLCGNNKAPCGTTIHLDSLSHQEKNAIHEYLLLLFPPKLFMETLKDPITHYFHPPLNILEEKLNYVFQDRRLLCLALTHSSLSATNYERLEFLGDAVLDWILIRHLYTKYAECNPGQLTEIRSASVNNESFSRLAVRLGLHNYVKFRDDHLQFEIQTFIRYLKKNESDFFDADVFDELSGEEDLEIVEEREDFFVRPELPKVGQSAPKILGDVFEGIAGAVFLDLHCDLTRFWEVYEPLLITHLNLSNTCPQLIGLNPVKDLIETVQGLGIHRSELLFNYIDQANLLKEGSASATGLYCQITLKGKILAETRASSRTLAKRLAASQAHHYLLTKGYKELFL